jgi:hypothetical protein
LRAAANRPSTYFAWLRQRRDPFSRAARVQRDNVLRAAIHRSWAARRGFTARARSGASC